MNTVVADTNAVPETGSYGGKELIFTITLQGPVNAPAILRNAGANQINYVFQEFNGTSWADISLVGTDLNNVLATGSPPTNVKVIVIASSYSQVRLLASASGGSTLEFVVMRYYNRPPGGSLPLLTV
jgi:hypothetical protein